MRIKPGLPVAASIGGVITAVAVLLVANFTRSPVAPCSTVEGRAPSPAPTPGSCPNVEVTTFPQPTVVSTVVTPGPPVVLREPGSTVVVVRPGQTVAPTPAPTTRPAPTRTPTRSPSPTCPIPTAPVVGCLGRTPGAGKGTSDGGPAVAPGLGGTATPPGRRPSPLP